LTPAQLDALRTALPTLAAGAPAGEDLLAYARFYCIDFQGDFPAADYRAGLVDSGPYRVVAHCWLQPDAKANLLIVHGYMDHTGLFGKPVRFGLEQGCNVLIFDLPGHGLSTGAVADIDEFTAYADAIAAVMAAAGLPQELPWLALAQSTGGAALVEFARHHRWPFARTALLAPLLRPAGWRQMRVARRLMSPFVRDIPRRFSRNTGDDEFLAFQRADPLLTRRIPLAWLAALERWLGGLVFEDLGAGPVLLVQGDHDHTVDWRWNLPRYQRLFPGSEIFMVPGAGHQLANETESVRGQYQAAVTEWLEVSAD
jgi:lysophospholipase